MRTAASRLCTYFLSGAAAVAFAAPALAQDVPQVNDPENNDEPNAEGGLGDIIVTARKVNENLQDVPVAVTAFTSDDIENQKFQRLQDIANFTPGLAIRQGQATSTALTLSLRGQIQTDTLATLDPSVGTYVDGIYWARAYGLNGGFLDTQSVQVLKGPQGTLFGRNTTGGALLINSNDPVLEDLTGRFSATYGRYNEIDTTGVVNVPVGSMIAVRLAAQHVERDGYTRNQVSANRVTGVTAESAGFIFHGPFVGSPNGLRFDERDRLNLRGKVLIQPTDNLGLLFSAEYFDADERTPGRQLRLAVPGYTANTGATNIAPAGTACTPFGATNSCPNTTYATGGTAALFAGILSGGPPPTSGANAAASTALGLSVLANEAAFHAANPNIVMNNEVPYSAARTYTYNFIGTLDTAWGQIKLLTNYRKVRSAALLDLEGSQFPIHITEGQQKLKQKSAELQFTGKAFDNAVDFAAGMFAFHESGSDQSISITVPALNSATSHFYGLIDNDSAGVYTQATWHLTDQFAFTGGVRYSVDDKGLETRNNNYNRLTATTNAGRTVCSIVNPGVFFNAGGEVVNPVQCAIKRRDSFSGWSYTAGLDYKPTEDILVYAKTAKGFRSGGQNLRAPTAQSFLPFDPEVAYSYEVGAKMEFLNRRLRVNLAAYHTDVNDIQRSTLIATAPVPPSTTPGTATILGNAGKARFRGAEAEITALLFEGFKLSVSGALIDPKYVRFADLTGDRSQERFAGVAKRQFAIGADYDREIAANTELQLHADYSWRSKVPTGEYFFPANPNNAAIVAATTAPSLGLLGARAAIEFKDRYEIAVFGRNLTNERDYVQNLLVAPLGYVAGIRQEPRTYGVTASVRF